MAWDDAYLELFGRWVRVYRGGNRDFGNHYNTKDLAFLAAIGHQPREFFDFVEDFVEEGTPSEATALLIASARRDYFLTVQNGKPGNGKLLTREDIPGFGEELEGFVYLPRILAKAKAKLRGELDPDLMYGCGGDRNFLEKNGNIHPADFLRSVWAYDEEPVKLVAWLRHNKAFALNH